MSFINKVVLITGGSAGIGASTAETFAKERATVAIVGRNEEKLQAVAKKCESHGVKVLTIKADISKIEETDTIVKKVIEKFGKLDVLVNNAGILKEKKFVEANFLEIYDETMNVNMRAVARITHFAVPHIIKTKGNIITISSIAGIAGTVRPNYIAYRTSKAALIHFSKSLAFEMAACGVRVNCISPGPTLTDIFEDTSADAEALKQYTALKRLSDTDEIADMVVYLASNKARGITGSNFVIDNGASL